MSARVVVGVLVVMVILILLLGYYMPDLELFSGGDMVQSTVDHEFYHVCTQYSNSTDAANILARISQAYVRVIKHLKKNCMNTVWASNIIYLCQNYNPLVIGEHIPRNLKFTSFVARKGQLIRLCLRKPENRMEFYDMTTLKFVALHELSHMAVQSYGHDDSFWAFFRFILLEASKIGEIKLIDYKRFNQPYCGLPNGGITDNPAL